MKRCPITYDPTDENKKYSDKGLRLLSPKLQSLADLPFSAEEQRIEAESRALKLSIQGVQPKLSAKLNIKKGCFDIVDQNGRYILKPQIERYKEVPENEDLTMRLAKISGIEVPLHGLLYSRDGSLTYFIRRFDRKGQNSKIHVEDFAQLSGKDRETKYNSSMENIATVIDQLCTFPAIEKLDLFRRTLFSFLVGNEDMHLKNFSLIKNGSKVSLAPAYDFLNTTVILATPSEEFALPLKGKKKNLTRNDFLQYFALERLKLSEQARNRVLDTFREVFPLWKSLVEQSFLTSPKKKQYWTLVESRIERLGLGNS